MSRLRTCSCWLFSFLGEMRSKRAYLASLVVRVLVPCVVPRLNDHTAVSEKIDHVSLRPRRRVQFDDGDVHATKPTLDHAGEATETRAHNDNVQPWGARVAPIRGHATKRALQRRVWPVEGLVGCCVRHRINIASSFLKREKIQGEVVDQAALGSKVVYRYARAVTEMLSI